MQDDPLVGPIVAQFIQTLPKRMNAICLAQSRSEWKEVSSLAHQMSGSSGSYGFPEMGRMAAQIERQAKHQVDQNVLAKSISSFTELCNAVVREGHRG